jgi:hypothetical protein
MGSTCDLARLADLKGWLGVSGSDDDVQLDDLISRTSRAMLAYLGRPSIIPELYTDRFDGGHEASILLRQWPVTSVVSCTVDGMAIPASSSVAVNADRGYIVDSAESAPPGRMQRLSLRRGTFARGVQNIEVSYYAGYQVSNESWLVPSVAPFTVTVRAAQGMFASDAGVTDSNGTPLVNVASNPGPAQYEYDDGGAYTFSAFDAATQVMISYGYVPGDLARCCIEWAADQYQYRSRIGQRAKSLGGHESVSFIVKDIPDLVRTVLQPYRRVVTT